MKKTSKNIGAKEGKPKIDYFEIVRTSKQSGKILTIADVRKQVLEARAEKLKRAS
jgi:predicted secreted protein